MRTHRAVQGALASALLLPLFTGLLTVAVPAQAAPATPVVQPRAACTPKWSKHQKQVEARLHLYADGRPTVAECLAIQRFQRRFGVRPADGYASGLTRTIADRLATADYRRCASRVTGLRICVDLTHQVLWVMRSGAKVLGPVPIRTGRRGQTTPTGWHRVLNKKVNSARAFSGAIMPYWQRFYPYTGLHQSLTWLYDPRVPGSNGCINMLRGDAIALYKLTPVGTPVIVFGRKPGT
jgi:hypothetical protein